MGKTKVRMMPHSLDFVHIYTIQHPHPLNGIKASKKLVLIVMSNVYLDLILSVDRSFAWARSDDSCPKDGGLRVQTVQDRSEIAASPPFALILSSVSAERELGKKIRLEGLTRQPSPCLGDRSEGEPLSLDRSDQTLSFYQSR
ncbi:hypothetical protein PVK06_032321 [Gossypium arboreum]|uniref:Uncharacterized protein n=1 Tax=Gossypium arboreum TaxID=29729 RepID=A0ABR0NTJ0_GOSAR|nr:hypothetical protein PVK06_032321 [Gossypium arboreum]